MAETPLTLRGLFSNIDGQEYGGRRELEEAVIEEVNGRITEIPAGYSYKDAIDGAVAKGWLRTNPDDSPGVRVELSEEESPA